MEDIEKIMELGEIAMFESSKTDKNRLSYWLPKVANCGFLIPETVIMQLNMDQFKWLTSDNYTEEKIKEFSDSIIEYLEENNFDTNRDLFIKTGNFSNKFVFSSCKLTDINKIGEQYLNVFYGGMMVNCRPSSEVVVREYIQPKQNRGTIYKGMPLNTEFRIFYDFYNKKVLGCFNYWDSKTMQGHLPKEDINSFNQAAAGIETEYEQNKPIVIKMAEERLKKAEGLEGKWSVDLMKNGEDFYLIDMAMAEDSYYFDRLGNVI
jgi:hypothetical protein